MQKIGIVGCGQMGAGIAEIAAKAGLDVVAQETTDELVARAQARIETSLRRAVEMGKLDEAGLESAFGSIAFTTDLGAMSDRDIVIEAVPENEDLKDRHLSHHRWHRRRPRGARVKHLIALDNSPRPRHRST